MARGKKKESPTPEERLQAALVPESEQPYKVPENWCWTYLGYVSDVVTGGTPSKKHPEYYGGLFPFFKPTDLDFGRHVVEASEYLTDEGKMVSRIIPEQSTAVCCIGSIGKCGFLEVEGATNQQINSAIPKFNPLFLYYYCNTHYFNEELWSKASATTISIVNKSKMESCVFPLPPLPEQQRIVDRIESLFAKLDEAKQKAQEALDSFEARKAAILHKAFTGELTAQWRKEHGVGMESWQTKKYSEICNIVRGGSPRPAGSPEFYGGNIPFMKVADITRNTGPYVNSTEYTIKEAGLKKTRMVDRNTLLLTNSGATLGVPAICTFKTTFNDGIAAFLGLNPDTLLFHYYFWTSKTAALRAINKGAAQPNLNTDIIGNVEISLPRENEQREIVRILDNLLAKEQQAKEAAEGMLEQIDLIKKAILARAFRGELGTNDPSEESAVELLKRVIERGEQV